MLACISTLVTTAATWVATAQGPYVKAAARPSGRLPSPTSSFANLIELDGRPQDLQARLHQVPESFWQERSKAGVRMALMNVVRAFFLAVRLVIWRLVGMVDTTYVVARNLASPRNRPIFFSDGWGDLNVIRDLFSETCGDLHYSDGRVRRHLEEATTLRWEEQDEPSDDKLSDVLRVRRASFRSPLHKLMPSECGTCTLRFCWPASLESFDPPWSASGSASTPNGIVFLLPATGEEDASERLWIAKSLAERSGLCSVIVDAPYYGERRPASQEKHYIRTVADYLIQSAAVTFEASYIMRACAHQWPGAPLCLSGFSWGGSMSGVVGIVGSQCLKPTCSTPSVDGGGERPMNPITAVTYAGSPTAAVLADGVLAADIDWDALRTDDEHRDETNQKLLQELKSMHLSSFTEAVVASGGAHKALQATHAVCFRDDGFVRTEYADELYRLLKSCCRPEACVQQWRGGGHAAAYLTKSVALPAAIETALKY